jgi:hypothetical protein
MGRAHKVLCPLEGVIIEDMFKLLKIAHKDRYSMKKAGCFVGAPERAANFGVSSYHVGLHRGI